MMTGTLSFAEVFRPSAKRAAVAYDVVLILAGTMLIAASAQFTFWLPFSAIPVTGQTFAILIIAALYGSRRAGLTVAAYIAEGAAGLPVFSSGGSGPAWLIGPTGGYLFGFLAAAIVVGWLAEHGWDRKIWMTAAAMITGNVIILFFGATWLAVLGAENVLQMAVFAFVPGDVFKIVLAALLLPAGWKALSLMRDI